jgi:sulfatase maturation enzyme AslB (radical SAM superfamily)
MEVKPSYLSGEQIMALIDKVHDQLPGVRTIYFCTDDVYYPNKQAFLDFIEIYKKSGYDYRILIQTSTYSIKEEDFPLLKSINCQHITLGFENCNEAVRKSLRKPQSQEKMEKIIKWGKEYGIQIYTLIMLMPPEVTMEALVENYLTISRWVLEEGVQISVEPVVYPYRGTQIFEQGYEFNCVTKENSGVKYRDAKWIYPKNADVRELCEEFIEKRDSFVDEYFKGLPNQHRFKGQTGVALVSLLGKLLEKRLPDFIASGL